MSHLNGLVLGGTPPCELVHLPGRCDLCTEMASAVGSQGYKHFAAGHVDDVRPGRREAGLETEDELKG